MCNFFMHILTARWQSSNVASYIAVLNSIDLIDHVTDDST